MIDTVIYTAIFGGFDKLSSSVVNKNVKYICFTDKEIKCPPWEIVVVKPEYGLRRENRKYKILSHKFFEDYDYSIYIDGDYTVMCNLLPYIKKWLGENDIAVQKHPVRSCLYEEALTCIGQRKDKKEIIIKQIQKYKREGYPPRNGLTDNAFIIRRHTPQIKKFNEMWWNEVRNHSFRDQISFCYVIWKLKMKYSIIPILNPRGGKNIRYLKKGDHK